MIWSRNSTFGYIPQRIKIKDSNRYVYTNIHCRIIHNDQKVEATQTSVGGWMNKEKRHYVGSLDCCSIKKLGGPIFLSSMDQKCYKFEHWCKAIESVGSILFHP